MSLEKDRLVREYKCVQIQVEGAEMRILSRLEDKGIWILSSKAAS